MGIGGVATLLISLWAGYELRRIRNGKRADLAPADELEQPSGELDEPIGERNAGVPELTGAPAAVALDDPTAAAEIEATTSVAGGDSAFTSDAPATADDALSAAIAADARARSFSRGR